MPILLRSQEILDLVKDKLIKQEGNVEILEQIKYASKVSGLPSLKIESLILFNNRDIDSMYIAKTESLDIQEILSVDEFREFVSGLPRIGQLKLDSMVNKIEMKKPQKPKM